MSNLTSVYEDLEVRDREILVKIWNADNPNKISAATLPFVDAWRMSRVVQSFYNNIALELTIVFPKGVALQELADKEQHLKETLWAATRKRNDEPS